MLSNLDIGTTVPGRGNAADDDREDYAIDVAIDGRGDSTTSVCSPMTLQPFRNEPLSFCPMRS